MFHPRELVHWVETNTNRQILARPADSQFWSLFREHGLDLEDVPASIVRASRTPCDLLIVLTTYARASLCLRKLQTLPELLRALEHAPSVHVLVLCDASSDDYSTARRAGRELFGEHLTWLDARERLGKPGYWMTYQTAFLAAKHLRPEHTLFLQDDVQYTASLLRDAYALWDQTSDDPRRRVLYLFSSEDDEPDGRWIRFRRLRCRGLPLYLTQWLDLQSYFVDLRFFALLDFRMVPVDTNRWRRRAYLSSGVGAQITRRLFDRCNIYQAAPPLVLHGAHPSEMNPEARTVRSLDNRGLSARFSQPVIC